MTSLDQPGAMATISPNNTWTKRQDLWPKCTPLSQGTRIHRRGRSCINNDKTSDPNGSSWPELRRRVQKLKILITESAYEENQTMVAYLINEFKVNPFFYSRELAQEDWAYLDLSESEVDQDTERSIP
jgi:hypothetical protein